MCGWKGNVHYELLGKILLILILTSTVSNWLRKAIKKNRPELVNTKGVVLHHDNPRPHSYIATQQKVRQLDWDMLMHPPYSPDFAPSDFHLFRSLQNSLGSIKLTLKEYWTLPVRSFLSKISKFLLEWNYGTIHKMAIRLSIKTAHTYYK